MRGFFSSSTRVDCMSKCFEAYVDLWVAPRKPNGVFILHIASPAYDYVFAANGLLADVGNR